MIRKLSKKIKPRRRRIGTFTYIDMSEMNVDRLIEYANKNHKQGREGQTLLIIDECAVIFNSRAWDAKDRMKWIIFFQQHRKLGYNVILISQADRLIDRQIRAFIEYNIKHRCVNNFTFFGTLLGLASGGKLFAAIKYWYGVNERCGVSTFRLNRKIAKIYNTYKIFNNDQTPAGKGAPAPVPVGVPLSVGG